MMQRATRRDHREKGIAILDTQLSEPHSSASLEDLVSGAGR